MWLTNKPIIYNRLRISDERKDSNEGVHNYDNYYNTGDTSNEKSVMNQTKNNSKESLFLKVKIIV